LSRVLLAGILCWPGLSLYSQTPNQIPPPVALTTESAPKLGPEELADLLAPIALYPDALIALILPASTVPADVVMGSRFLESNADISLVDAQPWDESVKSLTRYPEVLAWMNQNLEWTASLGEAFVVQPADVMAAIQKLRTQARTAGNLTDTPQQKVVVREEIIRIVPADPEVIYVPLYDPEVIYVQTYQPSYPPLLTFGVGFAVGSWLNYDFDWNRRCVYRGNWRGWKDYSWNDGHWNKGWNNDRSGGNNTVNVVNINAASATRWQPGANSRHQVNQRQRNNTGNARFTTPEARTERADTRAARPPNGNPVANAPVQTNPPPASARPNQLPRPLRLDPTGMPGNRGSGTTDSRNRDNRAPGGSVVTDPSAPVAVAPHGNRPTRSPDVVGSIPSNRDKDRSNTPSNTPRPNRAPDGAESTPPRGDRPNSQPSSSPAPNGAANEDRRAERPRNTPTAAPQIPGQIQSTAPTPGENPPGQEKSAREPWNTLPLSQPESNAPQPERQSPPQAQPQEQAQQESGQRQQRQQAEQQQQRQQEQVQQESGQRQQRQQVEQQQQRQQEQAQQESGQRQQRQQAEQQQQRQQEQVQQESGQRQQRQQAEQQQQRQQEQAQQESGQRQQRQQAEQQQQRQQEQAQQESGQRQQRQQAEQQQQRQQGQAQQESIQQPQGRPDRQPKSEEKKSD